MTKYPVYILSKGRWENPMTAKCFMEHNLVFNIVVEPQEEKEYRDVLGDRVLVLPFSNLGMGGTPARNWIWEHAKENGAKRHWIFDDNIKKFRRLYKGKRIECNPEQSINAIEEFVDRYENIAIAAFNYTTFCMNEMQHPFFYNVHAYSAMLIDSYLPHRWRLKYNEDVDLCLQVLDSGLCTVLFNAFLVDKTSTAAKMKGGNQTDLYKGNSFDKKLLKAKSLEEMWPQYVRTVVKFGRPHHDVQWKKFFKHPLIRRKDIDWDNLKPKEFGMKLKKVGVIQNKQLDKFYKDNK
jgi:hypothetical protein